MGKLFNCKIWRTNKTGFTFPEVEDGSPLKKNLLGRPNVGVAFSGGGTRSASAVLGQLRALNKLGLISKIRYISCVSGGSWAAVPFTYLPPKKKKKLMTDAEFLGEVLPPERLTKSKLKQKDSGKTSLRRAIAKSLILNRILKQYIVKKAGHETYSRAIGQVFLKPFRLSNYKRFFSNGPGSISAILKRNSGLRVGDFYRTKQKRPFLIAGGTILRPENPDLSARKIHFEMTPLYAGTRALHKGVGEGGADIGGGYVEPFGFDTQAPDDPPNSQGIVSLPAPKKKGRFALSDVVGTSGAAPAEFAIKYLPKELIFPEFRYWPLTEIGTTSAVKYPFGDGGLLENLGVMPLLMRRVKKIVVFVNTKRKVTGEGKGQINGSVRALFMETDKAKFNRVFPKTKFKALVKGLLAAKGAGKTVMFKDKYEVRKNDHYGIQGGWKVTVLWVYNERVQSWEDRLPDKTRKKIGKKGAYKHFPHYKTFFEDPPKFMDLQRQQVSLLAHLSCWNILENEKVFKDMLS